MILTAFDVKFHEKKDGMPPGAYRPPKKLQKQNVQEGDHQQVNKNNVEQVGPKKVEKKQCRRSGPQQKAEKPQCRKSEFIYFYIPSYTFIYLQIALYTFIYPHIHQNIQY